MVSLRCPCPWGVHGSDSGVSLRYSLGVSGVSFSYTCGFSCVSLGLSFWCLLGVSEVSLGVYLVVSLGVSLDVSVSRRVSKVFLCGSIALKYT